MPRKRSSFIADSFSLLKQTVSEWLEDQVPQLGAALAYYTVFSLAPLVLLLLAIVGFIFHNDPAGAWRKMTEQLSYFLDKSALDVVANIAQTAAARAGYIAVTGNKPVQVGYIGAIKNLVIHSLPLVNDELLTEINVENQIFDVTLIKGKITCKGSLLAECEMKIFIQSK